ncbi:leucine--tRNA ligase [Candidatus Woesearchaeota archaeon]|nr:leucine--tRNA ligase [Candidatus Woesearchaeota archaeon]
MVKDENAGKQDAPERINFNAVAVKWQKKWAEAAIFKAKEDSKKKKYYVLEMYPYPSASYLHMGHVRNYTIGDAYARFKRMQGFNVLYPMGYDSFGLPAETAAKKEGIHPRKYADDAMKKIMEYQKALGNSYDWDRVLYSHDPDYIKWNQYFFIKLLEKGLAYRKKAPVNWCECCQSVLANEEAEGGKCWRCDKEVVKKDLSQWFYKITAYADRLLEDLKKIDWPEKIKVMQENWIGKSYGTEIDFEIDDEKWSIFTTRPDTIYGVTFMVISALHPRLLELTDAKHKPEVEAFIRKCQKVRTPEEIEALEKEGVFIGKYAINPINNEEVPVYAGNFVLADYGCGMVMAVPAHDQRDFEFAKKYKIPVRVVINSPMFDLNAEKMSRAYTSEGSLINSGEFNGSASYDAINEITQHLEKTGKGRKTIQYKIKDWMISRQRYWGTPIPIIHCPQCGVVVVPYKDLPVLLPDKVDFNAAENPLLSSKEFLEVKCPKCGGQAHRETDTMGGFVDSSWYFLRYCDNKNKDKPFDADKVNYWMPVDQYVGGAEHAVMHLIYARFFVKALQDLGFVKFDEPFSKLFNQGILYKDGAKMSKSKGNIVTQDQIAKLYGIDTARFFLMFLAAPDKTMEWDDKTIEGTYRFLVKVYRMITEKKIVDKNIKNQESKTHKAIKEVTENIESFDYNIALIKIMDLANYLNSKEEISRKAAETLLLLLSPFTPHIAEELWEKIGNKDFISIAKWPAYDEKKIDEKLEAGEELYEKIRKDIISLQELTGIIKPNKVVFILPDNWKYSFIKELKKEMEKTRNAGELIKALCAKDKTHAKLIANFVPKFVKNPDKIPMVVLSAAEEKKALDDCIAGLEKEFKTKFEIVAEKESKHEKAANAMPGKPAIIFE